MILFISFLKVKEYVQSEEGESFLNGFLLYLI